MAGTQHTLKLVKRDRLFDHMTALDQRLKALRQQQDRIKKQKKQIQLQKAQQAVAQQGRKN